jgi:hypothetical protein
MNQGAKKAAFSPFASFFKKDQKAAEEPPLPERERRS